MKRLEKVLLAEDDADQEFMLQVLGYSFPNIACTIAVNGRDVFAPLEDYRPGIIFRDLNMPLMAGRQFLRQLTGWVGLVESMFQPLSAS